MFVAVLGLMVGGDWGLMVGGDLGLMVGGDFGRAAGGGAVYVFIVLVAVIISGAGLWDGGGAEYVDLESVVV